MAETPHQLAKAVTSALKAADDNSIETALDWSQFGDSSALLREIAIDIRSNTRKATGHFLAAGAQLLAARAAHTSGDWQAYVREACQMSPRSAQVSMQIADFILNRRPDLALVDTTKSVLLELSRDGVSNDTINAIKKRLTAGEKLSARDVKRLTSTDQQTSAAAKAGEPDVIDAEFEAKPGSEQHVSFDNCEVAPPRQSVRDEVAGSQDGLLIEKAVRDLKRTALGSERSRQRGIDDTGSLAGAILRALRDIDETAAIDAVKAMTEHDDHWKRSLRPLFK